MIFYEEAYYNPSVIFLKIYTKYVGLQSPQNN